MKKATLISLLALAALTLGAASAHAQAVKAEADSCFVLAPDCTTFVLVPDMMMLQSNNPNGNWMTRCVSNLPEGTQPPSQTVRCNNANTQGVIAGGVTCFGPDALETTDWQEVITPSGRVILMCHGSAATAPTP